MTFAESIQTCLRKYIDVSGRARRSEYWWFSLFQIIALVVAALVHEVESTNDVALTHFHNFSQN